MARLALRSAWSLEGPGHGVRLAQIVLARSFRYARQPQHALKIMSDLMRKPLGPWMAWAEWEALLAGALDREWRFRPAAQARAWLEACARGTAQPGDATADVEAALSHVPSFAAEWRDLYTAAHPQAPDDGASAALTAWRHGREARTPAPLLGIPLRMGIGEVRAIAAVSARVDGAGQRFLLLGEGQASAWVRSRRPGRVEHAMACLLLPPGGSHGGELATRADALFEQTYGIRFERRRHANVLRVLLHRIRAAVHGLANIERHDGKLRVQVLRPFAVPDPRCGDPLDERVLSLLSAHPNGLSSQDIASALTVSRRSAQQILARLGDDGSVSLHRHQRWALPREL